MKQDLINLVNNLSEDEIIYLYELAKGLFDIV